ncbi:MAG: hypothetical protein GWM90_16695 [Gemmatimonadetes bacterium]|nr:hypothetical protein [Gemmatimonadota bacterium]NIQ55928.1 hypothetical protein [Gemmatimonadota bacterium]NIU76126.1 hypothetical protein [Gammaproteobacteria bacterium]NIX45674.1 hypothetical protein [Gemmatimonadota bacterium]NIY09977.1 hypothetical protein [Gemmatimonadota bacterium]
MYGVAYDGAECADPIHTFARADSPGVHVALLHASVRDAAHWRPSPDALAVTGDALARLAVDYIALGDHHRPRMPDDFGGPPACYPGSFAATDLTEAGERGYVLVQVAPGRTPEVEHRASGVRAVSAVELDVSGLAHDVAVSEAAAARLPDGAIPAIRLVGEPSFPLDTDAVTAELRERYGHAAVVDETRYFAAERLDELAEGDTVAGHVVRLGRRRIREAADGREREIAQRALRAALRALEVE